MLTEGHGGDTKPPLGTSAMKEGMGTPCRDV